jgi:hypothetical protein
LKADSPTAAECAGPELDFIGCGKAATDATAIEAVFTSDDNALPQPMHEISGFSSVEARSETKFWRFQGK